MAVPLAWRVAIALAPVGAKVAHRIVKIASGPEVDKYLRVPEYYKRYLADPSVPDEQLSRELSAMNGYPVDVATYSGDFETRRVQLEWSLTGPNVLDEDVRVCTFHFVKLVGGLPSPDWLVQDFADIEVAFTAWWNSLKNFYNSGVVWSNIAFYKEGPNIVPPQPPVYANAQNLPGGSTARELPPQLALSVTEKAGAKKNWGRFYLPAPAMTSGSGGTTWSVTNAGRPDTAFMTVVADATDTLYQATAATSKPCVIYRSKLEAGRPHSGDTPLPERPANAQTVDEIQIDDVWDVVRSRRYETAMLRIQRAIGTGAAAQESAESPTVEPAE